MITTIHTNRAMVESIQPYIDEFNAKVYVDLNNRNPYNGFIDMLKFPVDDYRLHIKCLNDITIADDLKKYLPTLLNFMVVNNVQILSLSSPANKRLTMEYFLGKRIADYRNDRYKHSDNSGVIYSKKFVEIMKKHVPISKDKGSDIAFLNEVLAKNGILTYVHLPILIQGNAAIPNNLFDKDFLIKDKQGK